MRNIHQTPGQTHASHTCWRDFCDRCHAFWRTFDIVEKKISSESTINFFSQDDRIGEGKTPQGLFLSCSWRNKFFGNCDKCWQCQKNVKKCQKCQNAKMSTRKTRKTCQWEVFASSRYPSEEVELVEFCSSTWLNTTKQKNFLWKSNSSEEQTFNTSKGTCTEEQRWNRISSDRGCYGWRKGGDHTSFCGEELGRSGGRRNICFFHTCFEIFLESVPS